MSKFSYVVTDQLGRKKEGIINASNQDSAIKKLREKDEIIISIIEEKYGKIFPFGKPGMGLEDKITFTKSLATMLKVGITITEAFEILAHQTKKTGLKRMYEDIIDMIKSGQSLANSLKKYNHIFPDIFISMIETGETSGNLEKVLTRLTIQLEKDYEIRKKVISAFIYPAVIIVITMIMSIGIVAFIMPKITKIFEKFDITLPLPTRVLIAISKFLTEQTLLAILSALSIIAFFIFIPRLKFIKPFWHTLMLKLPVFGDILVCSNVARFARTINSLLQSGVPITKGFKLTGNMLNNIIYKIAIDKACEKIEQGANIGESLEKEEKLFPQLATRMLYIGEKTGSLELTTKYIALLYEKNVENKTKNLTVLIEPLLLVFMAVMVGGIALSIILPIYQLPNMLNK